MISHKTYFEEVGLWQKNRNGVLREYIIGFLLSLMLTLGAYAATLHSLISKAQIPYVVSGLILLQFFVQVRYFLHIEYKNSSRERLSALLYAIVVVIILLSGSVWIMKNLNARMMPSSEQMNRYMQRNPGL